MSERETHDLYHERRAEPVHPSILPTDLADFLRTQRYACLTHPTDQGVVLVIKAPGDDIDSVRGRVPIQLQHELYDYPFAPVVRMITSIYDRADQPLRLETFINVGDPQQRSDYATLARQPTLEMLFYDEQLTHRLSKAVHNLDSAALLDVLQMADRMLASIPAEQFDFDMAKELVMKRIPL